MGFYVYFYGTDIMNQIKSSIEINKRSFLDEIFLVLNQIGVNKNCGSLGIGLVYGEPLVLGQ